MLTHRYTRMGFTLIEMLVVIALIALLIATLAPALSAARRTAQLSMSLSNLRQIGMGMNTYTVDNDGYYPYRMENFSTQPYYAGWCTWSFGGKFADPFWKQYSLGMYDLAPSARPINEYLYSTSLHKPVTGSGSFGIAHARPGSESERITSLELDIFKSPRDVLSFQRGWTGDSTPEAIAQVSSYDDIGTSYHENKKWHRQLVTHGASGDVMHLGNQKLRAMNEVDPSRFVLCHDQVADIVSSIFVPSGLEVVDSNYGRESFSAMAYIDGHANFVELEPNQTSTEDYTFHFELTPPRRPR